MKPLAAERAAKRAELDLQISKLEDVAYWADLAGYLTIRNRLQAILSELLGHREQYE